MFTNLCFNTWYCSDCAKSNHAVKHGCEDKAEMMTMLDPVQMYDWISIFTKLKNCKNKVAYVSKSAEIMKLGRKLNKPGRPKRFQSGSQNQLTRLIFWSFRVALENDVDDIHLKRLKNLVEFGLYRYLKNTAINSTNMKVLRQNEKGGEFISLNLESNIASLFYLYCFFSVVICIAAVFGY